MSSYTMLIIPSKSIILVVLLICGFAVLIIYHNSNTYVRGIASNDADFRRMLFISKDREGRTKSGKPRAGSGRYLNRTRGANRGN
jgi:hypothetical protein